MKISEALFRVIDTETTGLDPEDRVCEVAWGDVAANGDVHSIASTLVNPGVPIKPGASAAHHLVDADVADAPSLAFALGHMSVPPGLVFVAHNAGFDRGMLNHAPMPNAPWLCTLRLAKHVLPDQESYACQFLRYALRLSVNLPKDTAAHRAAADVEVTVALLLHLLPMARAKWPAIDTVEALVDQVNRPVLLTTIRFSKYAGQPYRSLDAGMLRWIVANCTDREDDVHTARTLLSQRK